MKHSVSVVMFVCYLAVASQVQAAHPLFTDDAGVSGAGTGSIELNAGYGREYDGMDRKSSVGVDAVVTYGFAEHADVTITTPYVCNEIASPLLVTRESGFSDISVEMKYRLYEHDGLAFSVKPVITLPTGDVGKGLGRGRSGYGLRMIGTKELRPLAMHVNLGYLRNESKLGERRDISHASTAVEYSATDKLKVVANAGVETNHNRAETTAPAFLLSGIIYALTHFIDIDLGYKTALSRAETDHTYLAGIKYKF